MVDMAATGAAQHLSTIGMLAHKLSNVHGLPTRSLPVFGIVDAHLRGDFTGTHSVMLAGASHVASLAKRKA